MYGGGYFRIKGLEEYEDPAKLEDRRPWERNFAQENVNDYMTLIRHLIWLRLSKVIIYNNNHNLFYILLYK